MDQQRGKSPCGCVFVLGFAILIWWLVWQPREVKVYVDRATCSVFSLNSTTSTTSQQLLSFNISIQLSFRNPNRRIQIYYDTLEATVLYRGLELKSEELENFHQFTKSTKVLEPVFAGQTTAAVVTAESFGSEKSEGFFNIELKLRARLRRKIWFIKIGHFKPKFNCLVRIPAPGNTTSAAAAATFESFKC